ncbi:hypothetical protein VIGAN_02162200, partial [Vigna angularis var. angularis]
HDKCSRCLTITCCSLGSLKNSDIRHDSYRATLHSACLSYLKELKLTILFPKNIKPLLSLSGHITHGFCKSRHGVILVWLILIQPLYHLLETSRINITLVCFIAYVYSQLFF